MLRLRHGLRALSTSSSSAAAATLATTDKAGRPLSRHRHGDHQIDVPAHPGDGRLPPSLGRTDPLWGTPNFDADVREFPREGQGINYALNWSLATDGVTPAVYAHRNLSLRKLEKVVGDKIKPPASSATPNPAPFSKQSFEAVAEYLSNVNDVFVQDSAVGSHRSAELRTRVISDSASMAAGELAGESVFLLLSTSPTVVH